MLLRATHFTDGAIRRGAMALLVAALTMTLAMALARPALARTVGEVTEFPAGEADECFGGTGGITTGLEGDLWFTESLCNKASAGVIGRMTPDGEVTELDTGIGSFPSENAITTGQEGDLWFTFLSGEGIGRITPSGEATQFKIGEFGPELVGITTGTEGDLWFSEDGGRIGRISPSGEVKEFPVGSSFTAPDGTDGITVGPEGDIWFTEHSTGKIGRLTPSGSVTLFSNGIPAEGEPTDIAAGPEGNLWFTQEDKNISAVAIGRITPAGNITEFTAGLTGDGRAGGIAAGPEGDMWFTQPEAEKVGRITPTGVVTEYTAGFEPTNITQGPEGNMWFTHGESEEVGRIATGTETTGPRPAVTGLTPNSGAAGGDEEVIVTGANLEAATSVKFGAVEALSFVALSPTKIKAFDPAGTAGSTVNVTVTSPGGVSKLSALDRFKYLANPLKLMPATLKLATVGVPYTDTLHVSGGTEPYTFALASGSLPEGIELSSSGELHGTPETVGSATFVVQVTDAAVPALSTTREYTLTTQLDITPRSLGRLTAGVEFSKILSVEGGTPPYTLSLESATPPGLEFSFDGGTDEGLLHGVPTTAGSYVITARAGDSASPQHTGTRTFKVRVGLGVVPATLADGHVGASYESALEVTGGSGSYSYEVSAGALPEGLELGSTTGEITGTPKAAGKSAFTVTVKDLVTGIVASVKYHLTVLGSPFPTGTFEFKELSGGDPFDTDEIAFTLKRSSHGVLTGTMEDSDKSVGSWTYDSATERIEFNWVEGTIFEPHQERGEHFVGACEPAAETCSGTGELDEHTFTLARPS